MRLLGVDAQTNFDLAEDQIARLDASVINSTNIAQFLTRINLKKYFDKVYPDPRDADAAWLEIWGKVSALFAESNFKEAATCVCGADPTRVFRAYEQDALLRNKHVKIINGRTSQLFRDFGTLGAEEAFRLICLTELLEIRKHAQNAKTPEAWKDYHQRRRAFLVQFGTMRMNAAPLSSEEKLGLKQSKREILALHKITAIQETLSTDDSVPSHPACRMALSERHAAFH